jgi:pantoate--beta-alanine ligase
VRDPDGLALSSRNARLSSAERQRATALHRALEAVRHTVLDGERDPARARAAGLAELEASGLEPEYLELVEPETFRPAAEIAGELIAVVAARVGATRLIDNEPIRPPAIGQANQPVPARGALQTGEAA